jgi:predicted nucleic acid-binding protein
VILVDTSVWIDWDRGVANPQTHWLRENLTRIEIGLTDLVLCELLQGCRDERHAEQLESALGSFQVLATGGAELARFAARLYRSLRRTGWMVASTVDCCNAALCLARGHMLLHRDRDFDAFERHFGLRVVHP